MGKSYTLRKIAKHREIWTTEKNHRQPHHCQCFDVFPAEFFLPSFAAEQTSREFVSHFVFVFCYSVDHKHFFKS